MEARNPILGMVKFIMGNQKYESEAFSCDLQQTPEEARKLSWSLGDTAKVMIHETLAVMLVERTARTARTVADEQKKKRKKVKRTAAVRSAV